MTRWFMAGALLLLLAACAPYQHTWPGDGAPRYYGHERVPDMGPTWRAQIIDEPTVPVGTAEVTVVKSASPMTFSAVGDRIEYTITVRNTGDVPVSDVTLEDQLLAWVGEDARGIGTLAPGAEQVFSGTYEITQADVDAESVVNVALASGQDPDDVPIDGSGSVTVVHEEVAAPSLVVSKSASPMTFSAVGDEIAYTITVTNSGNEEITDISVSDPLVGLNTSIASLDLGESQVFDETYTITQEDLDRGFLTNTAAASGQDPDDDPVNGEGSVTVMGPVQQASLVVSKSASPMTFSAVGDEITYTITVTNDGDVTVTDITVTDTLLGLDESIVSLDPGESQVFSDQTSSLLHATPYTLTYTITQVDLDRGFVTNTATVSGQDPDGDPVNGEGSVTVMGPAQQASLAVSKSASPMTFSAVGEEITYPITVSNTGTV